MLKSLQKFLWVDRKAALLILLGSVTWSLTMVKSGLRYDYGVGFWGPNGHDGVWHIALARALSNGSLQMPIFAGESVRNYHVGFDVLLALINKTTSIPLSVLYFQLLPVIFSLAIGLLTYKFVFSWKKSKAAAWWSTFFVYFGGNLGWVVTFLRTGEVGGESMFWAQPAALTLINPPFALSLVLILLGLNFLLKPTYAKSFIVCTLSFGLLIQVKAYGGIVVLGALLATAMHEYFRKRSMNYFKVFLCASLISFIVFLPNLGSGSLLQFKPFWFLETMMSFPDRLGWARFGEAMVNYRLGGEWIRALAAYALALLIFWYGNLGTRFVNEFYWATFIKNKKKLEAMDIFFVFAIALGIVASMLFVQKGTAWNTIQFFYYSLFFTSIISGVVFAGILESKKNKSIKNVLAIGVLLFTLPTTVSVLKHYLPMRPPARIPNYELSALEFLAIQPHGVVLVMPFDRDRANAAIDNPPRPLYLYESTAYVSAYSGQIVWLEDEVNLDITGYNWQPRREKLLSVLASGSSGAVQQFLAEERVNYVYLVGNQRENEQMFSDLIKIYENSDAVLYMSP